MNDLSDYTRQLRSLNIKGKRLTDLNKMLVSEPQLAKVMFDPEERESLTFTNGISFNSLYEFSQIIGAGAFGLVFSARYRKTDELCAIKVLCKNRMNSEDVTRIEAEMEILRKIKHQNVIQLHGVKQSKDYIFIIMEYLPGGTLTEWIKYMHSSKISHDKVDEYSKQIITGILKGIKEIHEHDFMHRDLKPDNILFAIPGDPSTVKIADFGLCAKSDLFDYGDQKLCGTVIYMAPEQLFHKKYNNVFFRILIFKECGYLCLWNNSVSINLRKTPVLH